MLTNRSTIFKFKHSIPHYLFSSVSRYTDPYKLLGVTRSNDYKEIKRQYLKLVKKHHPDLDPDNQAVFMNIKDAFEQVQYDRGLKKRMSYQRDMGDDMHDFRSNRPNSG